MRLRQVLLEVAVFVKCDYSAIPYTNYVMPFAISFIVTNFARYGAAVPWQSIRYKLYTIIIAFGEPVTARITLGNDLYVV